MLAAWRLTPSSPASWPTVGSSASTDDEAEGGADVACAGLPHGLAEPVGQAAPSRGCETVSAWRVVLQPGARSPEHTLTGVEAFVALRGAARVSLDRDTHDLRAGDSEPFEAVCCMAAGGEAIAEGSGSFVPL